MTRLFLAFFVMGSVRAEIPKAKEPLRVLFCGTDRRMLQMCIVHSADSGTYYFRTKSSMGRNRIDYAAATREENSDAQSVTETYRWTKVIPDVNEMPGPLDLSTESAYTLSMVGKPNDGNRLATLTIDGEVNTVFQMIGQ